MSRTINELNTTDTLADADKFVIWQNTSQATRAITAVDMAEYFGAEPGGPFQPLDELLTAIAAQGPNTANGDFIQLTGQDTVRVRKLTVATYAALTVIPASFRFDDMLVYVSSRATDGDGGEGWWRFDAGSSTTANGGTILAPDAGTGRWFRQYSGPLNVRWFGAKGDGSTDDTAAIQAAIDAAGDYGVVYIPPHNPGQFYKAHELAPKVGQNIVGAGMLNTEISWTGGTTPIFNIIDNDAGACNVFMRDMQIYLPAPGGSSAHCINYGGGQNTLHLERVWLAGGYAGLYAAGGEVEVTQCVFENNGTFGFWGEGAYQVRLVNNWFGAAATNCIRLTAVGAIRGQSIEIIGNYITDASQDAISVDGVDGLTITANMFRENGVGTTNTYSNIDLTNAGKVAIVGNTATVVSGSDVKYHVEASSSVAPQDIVIAGNAFEAAKTANYSINTWPAGTPSDLPAVYYGTTTPTAGAYRAGSIVVNVAPASGSPAFWICSVSGTPGTWLPLTQFNFGTFSDTGVTQGRTFTDSGRWEKSSTDGAALTPHQAFYNTNGQVGGIYTLDSATQFRPTLDRIWTAGVGTPEGVLTATIGSLYTRTDGGAATTLYVKESGSGNTGWVAK